MRRILLGGSPGSGKSTVAGILHRDFRLETVSIGDVLLDNLRQSGVECSTRTEIGPRFLERYPSRQIFDLVREKITNLTDCCIDGVRLALTCNQFKEWDTSIEIWFIETSAVLGQNRLRDRLRDTHIEVSKAEQEISRAHLYDAEEPKIRLLADITICNDGSLSDLAENVGKAFKREIPR